jgi:hypothetical protein
VANCLGEGEVKMQKAKGKIEIQKLKIYLEISDYL